MIKSVKKASDILQLLSNTPEIPLTVSKIAQAIQITKPTCSHILETLCDATLVERVSRKEGYRLGAGTFMLTRYGRYQESLINVASPIIQWVRSQIDVTVVLSVVCDGTKYIISHSDSADSNLAEGEIKQGNIANTSTGRMMMAYMDSDSLNRVLYRLDPSSPWKSPGKTELAALETIRKRGYAHVYDAAEDKHSYAFRIHDGKKTVAAVGIFYSGYRDCSELRTRIIRTGTTAADEISRRLIFSKP